MTDEELRALVRDAVRRRLGQAPEPRPAPPVLVATQTVTFGGHPSHFQYAALSNPSGACVIEPSVGCDHCGYCKSHGH